MKKIVFLLICSVFLFGWTGWTEDEIDQHKEIFKTLQEQCDDKIYFSCNRLTIFYSEKVYAEAVGIDVDLKKVRNLKKIACENGNFAFDCMEIAFCDENGLCSDRLNEKDGIYFFKKGFDLALKECETIGSDCYTLAAWQDKCNKNYDCADIMPKNIEKVKEYADKTMQFLEKECVTKKQIPVCIYVKHCYDGEMDYCEVNREKSQYISDIIDEIKGLK